MLATRPGPSITPGLVRVTVLFVVTIAAFHVSLATLLRSLRVETPLAYLGLVPVIAAGLMLSQARPSRHELTVNDRQVDWIVGVPLLAASVIVLTIFQVVRRNDYWVYRWDVIALPMFVAGATALLFGTRALLRVRSAVLFLFLAWPWPWKTVLSRLMDAFTEMTLHALHAIVDHVPIATALGGDGSRFAIAHGRGTFTLSVASACAGVNGVVGFFVVGVALLLVVRGPARRKALWLALGLMGIWLLNIVRIVLLFAAGRRFGATVAIDGLHPYIGLALFTAGVMALVAAMPLFRLEWDRVDTAERVGALHTVVRAVPRARYAFAAVCVTAIVLTVANSELRNFELTSDSLGQARLAAFAERPPIVSGVRPQLTSTFDHGRAFFGKDSTWQRFEYTGGQTIVLADVVETSSLGPFNEFTLERCYDFHRFQKLSTETVNLAGGVTADLITWHAASQGTWTALTWVWPVQAGARPRFERVTLLVNAPGYLRDGAAVAAAPVTPVRNLAATLDSALRRNPSKGALNTRMLQTESFIKKFGAALVSAKAMAR